MKLFVPLLSWVLVSQNQNEVVAQTGFVCSICGDGFEVTTPDGVVTIPQNGDFLCSELEAFGEQGGIDASTCTALESFVESPCGCASEGGAVNETSVNGTSVPTVSPTIAPTFGPAPDCYVDLDNIQQRESTLSVQEIQVGRTYVLCPDTVFFMGTMTPTGQTENGFTRLTPRPNVLYKCGETGSSENGCRLLGGTIAIHSFGGDAEHTNVTFQGLTIESSQFYGVVAETAGDLTFIDCVFKNHENAVPVAIFFDSPLVRRLSQPNNNLHGDDHSYSEPHFPGFLLDAREGNRHLQDSTGLTTLTMTFKQCIFEGNKLGVNLPNLQPGIITSVTPETILAFEDVIFRNNDYGDPALQIPGAAIFSAGPLTLKNTCFLDNSFVLLDGAVVYLGTDGLDVSNNYISPVSDQLNCSFIASYPDQSAWVAGTDLICTKADATSCESDIPPVSPPTLSPEDQPTRIPVPRLTLPPASSPPSSARMSSPLPQICMAIIWSCGLVLLQ